MCTVTGMSAIAVMIMVYLYVYCYRYVSHCRDVYDVLTCVLLQACQPLQGCLWCTDMCTVTGMSAIAGMFMMYLDEEDAFWCLVSLLERHKYLVGYFSEEMSRFVLYSILICYAVLSKKMSHCSN